MSPIGIYFLHCVPDGKRFVRIPQNFHSRVLVILLKEPYRSSNKPVSEF